MKERMKKRAALIIVLILGLLLIACGSSMKKLSAEKCKSLMESAGLNDMETVVEDATFLQAYRLDADFYGDLANLTEMTGEEKKYLYQMSYLLGDNKEQAEAAYVEYINYLIDQGFEYNGESTRAGGELEFYVKGTNVIMFIAELSQYTEQRYTFHFTLY